MTRLEVLKKARRLISNPARWTKGALARRNDGLEVDPESKQACRWCAEGACWKVCDDTNLVKRTVKLLDRMCGKNGKVVKIDRFETNEGLTRVNDELGRIAALHVFDRAIRRIETGG